MSKLKNKTITSIISLVSLCAMISQPLCAAECEQYVDPTPSSTQSTIVPYWNNVRSVMFTHDVENSNIYIKLTITGIAGTTYKNGTVTLEKISGSNTGVKRTWKNLTSSSNVFSFSDNSYPASSGTYRATFSIDAVRNGVSENITRSKDLTV